MDFYADGFEVEFVSGGTGLGVWAARGGTCARLRGTREGAACVVEDFEFGEGGMGGGCCVGVLIRASRFFVDGVVVTGAGAGAGAVACVRGCSSVVVGFCGGGGGRDEGGAAAALVGGLGAGFGARVGCVELFGVLVYVCFGTIGVRTETGGFHEEATRGWSGLVTRGVIAVSI